MPCLFHFALETRGGSAGATPTQFDIGLVQNFFESYGRMMWKLSLWPRRIWWEPDSFDLPES